MKELKKHLGALCILIFICATKVNAQTVYINSPGTKYHQENCVQLGRNRSAISLKEAQHQGYTMCLTCQLKSQAKLNSKQKSTPKESQTALAEEKNKKESQK